MDVTGLTTLDVLNMIQELYKRRVGWHKAEKGLTLQAKAICRRVVGGDKDDADVLFAKLVKLRGTDIMAILSGQFDIGIYSPEVIVGLNEVHPILAGRELIQAEREKVEAEMERAAKTLPIARWIEAIDGVSYLSLAAVIGSAGDLHRFPTVQGLWKRMGLAVMPNGRQRMMRDPEQAKLHGYSPPRRSIMWNIGASILRSQSERQEKAENESGKKVKTGVVTKVAGPWRQIYDERRAYEAVKNEAGEYSLLAAKRLAEATFGPKTEAYKCYSQGKLPPLHLHMRAQRFMEKRFLRELWCQWRRCMPVPVFVEDASAVPAKEAAVADH